MFQVKYFFLIIFSIALTTTELYALPKFASHYFSPNLDGSKDTIAITLNIEEKALNKWKVSIYEKTRGEYKLIRLYESFNAKEIADLTTQKFIKRIFEKKQSLVIPDNVIWDGYTKIPKNKKKEVFNSYKVKDGEYYYRITAIDEAGNTSYSPLIPIQVDTVSPLVSLEYPETIFSPNGDGNKEKLVFNFNLTDFEMNSDVLSLKIVNTKQDIVFEKNFANLKGKSDIKFSWDGQYQQKDVPQGNYKAIISSKDFAGNKKTYPSILVELVRDIEKVSLTLDNNAFAPNNNGYFDLLTFNLSSSSIKGLKAWKIEILRKEKLIYNFTGAILPELVIYEGQINGERVMPDGEYVAKLKLKYRSGNMPVSPDTVFIVDTTPPKLNLSIKNKDRVFLPKAKNNNQLIIQQSADGSGDESYMGIISDVNGEHIYYREFDNNLPETLTWDGKNSQGKIVAGRYYYTLLGEDKLGNKSELISKPFELIDELATVLLKADTSAFSPNGDGKKEVVKITVEMKNSDKKRVQKQKLEIHFNNKLIRKIESFSSAGDFAFKESYLWDGKDDRGKILSDGKYSVKLRAQLTGGEIAESSQMPIYIDTKSIEIDVKVESSIFSPNGDGRKDFIIITQIKKKSSSGNSQDKITASIKDEKGISYRQQSWLGELPSKITWNGSDQTKSSAPQGVYTYILHTVDHASNEKIFKTKPFKLVREIENVGLLTSANIFSRRSTKPVIITPIFNRSKDFNSYSLVAVNSQGEKNIIITKTNISPHEFRGRDKDGNQLKDGQYQLYLQALYSSGNHPISTNVALTIDNKGPSITINSRPNLFSPDRDGFNDTLYLNIKAIDESRLRNSMVNIYRLREFGKNNEPFSQTFDNYRQTEKPIKTWDLNDDANHLLKWDGRGKNGELAVESANDYQVFVTATDIAGNKSIAQEVISVDILVEKIGEGRYRIIINSINFKYDSDQMIGNYRKSLNRLAEILNKFTQYQFTITGHTDGQGGIEYNQKLSIKRAKAVYNYLIKRKIQPNRMSIQGKGKSEPLISPEKTKDDKRKNRRVEFYLIKEKKDN